MKKQLVVFLISWLLAAPLALASTEKIVVGAKTFTEQFLLARMVTLILQNDGYQVDERMNVTTRVLRELLIKGEVDIYWEYTGTAYSALFQGKDTTIARDDQKLYSLIRDRDLENGVTWLQPALFSNGWKLVVPRTVASHYEISNISDLARVVNQGQSLIFGMETQFYARPDGFQKLGSFYGFVVPKSQILFMGHSGIYGAMARGQIQVGMGYGTDPQLLDVEFIGLNDDRSFFPVYSPAPTLKTATITAHPELATRLDGLGPRLDQETMIRLIHAVEVKKQPFGEVAKTWLKSNGFLQ